MPSSRDAGFPALRLMMLATLIALAMALWYLVSHQLRSDADVTWFAAEAPCDLQEAPCTATLGSQGELQFAMAAPDGIVALAPLPLTVTLEGVDASAVRVDFVGRDMDMGLHRFPLERQPDGRFHGQGQVSLCTEDIMSWQARVVVETPDGRLGGRFDFTVERSTP
ncbi:hypothetical protein [Halomonas sp. NO4]|uniref:hypothetical protein n=1 Tax=Halomonas sp. NO4 TaxID=2484813 RepID=UPI001F08F5BD|nr:hypothetical protein [Halomonas sp. NO4]